MERPAADITARDIAAASGANLASISYHFGSKDALIAYAIEEGFRRWLAELAETIWELSKVDEDERVTQAVGVLHSGLRSHRGLVNAFLAALARAPHDSDLREVLARSYAESRQGVAALLGLGKDEAALDAASLLLATFDGLLIQALVDDEWWPDAAMVARGMKRLETAAE